MAASAFSCFVKIGEVKTIASAEICRLQRELLCGSSPRGTKFWAEVSPDLFHVEHTKTGGQRPAKLFHLVFHVERSKTNSTGRRVFHVKQVASLVRFC